jgi:hypothetical protein
VTACANNIPVEDPAMQEKDKATALKWKLS